MKELWQLFWIFFRIGAFTVGGGYAMLPVIQKEFVDVRGWATNDEIANYYAIGQCTPGIIAVNTATFLGYKRKGFWGGLISTLGMITPSIIIISVIASFISNFADLAIVQHAFAAIRVCVAVLVINTVIKFINDSIKNKYAAILFIASLLVSFFISPSPILIILVAGALGFLYPCKGGAK